MICKTCCMPDTRPDTHFHDGQCSACISYEKRKTIDWEEREDQLVRILEENKNDTGYDCIVPSSGGKDSHWQVLKLIELGAKPLVVTATTCHLTEIGRKNIDNLSRYATTIEVSPNKEVRAKLNRLGLEMVGDISWPEHVSIFTTPFKIAEQTGIPLIFYGENPQTEYGGPPGSDEAKEMTRRWVSEYGGFLGLRPQDMIGIEGLTEHDISDYMPPSTTNATAYFLGQFFEWDSHRNAEIAISHGMKTFGEAPCEASWWDMENLDNAQTGLHDHMMYLKYGYGRLAAQLSVDVRAGRIDRASALEIIKQRDGLFPYTYAGVHIDDVLSRIGMTRDELTNILQMFKA